MIEEHTMLPECQLVSRYSEKRFDKIDSELLYIRKGMEHFLEFKGEINAKVSFTATLWGIIGGAVPAGIALALKFGGVL